MKTMLELKNVHTYYGNCPILKGLSLEVPKGKVVALLGRNGVGKTTTMKTIMGIVPKRQGSVTFAGEDITHLPTHKIAQRGLALVPQGRRLFKSLTVMEHIDIFARGNQRWDSAKILELFPRLAERTKHRGNELSGGEQQMLAIARALMTNPELLLMDEPTEGLAPLLVKEVGRLIKVIKDQGYSILLTEQKLKFVEGIADEIYLMADGQIVYHDLPANLEKDPETKLKYLGV